MRSLLILLTLVGLAVQGRAETAVERLCIAGDSTAASSAADSPIHGWGEQFGKLVSKHVQVLNRAKGGASSKSYQMDGVWKELLQDNPTVVFIQFGVNDAVTGGASRTSLSEFRLALSRYLEGCRKRNATPVLLTPVCPRSGNPKLAAAVAPYAELTRTVARDEKVTLIDVYARSAELYEQLGAAKSLELSGPPGDPIHLGRLGAFAIAELVRRELWRVDQALAARLLPRAR